MRNIPNKCSPASRTTFESFAVTQDLIDSVWNYLKTQSLGVQIPMSIFVKIAQGLKWFGKEVGKVFSELPKVIRLTTDAEQAATTVLPETIAVIQDAGELVTATAKDSGVFFTAFAGLSMAVASAIDKKALDITADEQVVVAFELFCKAFKRQNVEDILTAWHKLSTDAQTLDATVVATLEKMKKDAGA